MHEMLNKIPLVIPILTLSVFLLRHSGKNQWQLSSSLAKVSYVVLLEVSAAEIYL